MWWPSAQATPRPILHPPPRAFAERFAIPETVPKFELLKYVGIWRQIAYVPNRFQSMCVDDTQAEYTVISEGRLKVITVVLMLVLIFRRWRVLPELRLSITTQRA